MASLFSQGLLLASILVVPGVLAGTPKTCSNPQISCQNTTAVSDLCCFNAPGGQILLTQFWDYNPTRGPVDKWTIHGLWPDKCDGTYEAYCDPSRERSNIRQIIQSAGKTELLSFMDGNWKGNNGDESFWSHEWDKHGTCISTLEPSCYVGYTPDQEVVDYFQETVDLHKGLDSYTYLARAGIVPSNTATYTTAQIQGALKTAFGFEATIGCISGVFNEIWYHYNVQGSLQTGSYIPTAPDGTKSTCPASGIRYPPKSGSTTTPPPPGTSGTPGAAFSGSGYLNGQTSGAQKGCLISTGKWFATGTCATYTATPSGSGFTLGSSKGACGIVNSVFTCGSGAPSTVFTSVNDNLAVNGNSQLYAAGVPAGSTQQSVYTTAKSVNVKFTWQKL